MNWIRTSLGIVAFALLIASCTNQPEKTPPNIILLMTDDQGWAQTGYYGHPVLETLNLDAMAESGLRLDRFYAGAPVCSPTRASVLTGRAPERTGVPSHGYALRLQEITIAEALRAEGYATGHFGKWHLNALRGPGVPIFRDDPYGPAASGFDRWVSVTNFFEIDPLMSDQGEFREFKGTSSDVIVHQALEFIGKSKEEGKPFLAVIWDGSPHRPWLALPEDSAKFSDLEPKSQAHYGELAAFDRSVGTLRELDVADNTILWYCSDNGGLPDVTPSSVAPLRGFKGSVWEGGLRVPAIIEWPAEIRPGKTSFPASTMDIFPTVADILDLPKSVMGKVVDGVSILPLLRDTVPVCKLGIPFRYTNRGALIEQQFKLVATDLREGAFELYDLEKDPAETTDISGAFLKKFEEMKSAYMEWTGSVDASVNGEDYPEGNVREDHPEPEYWMRDPRYKPYLDEWVKRPEYADLIRRGR